MPNSNQIIAIVALLFGAVSSVYATENATFSIAGGVEKFNWREFDSLDRELLEESGVRYTFSGNYDNLRRINSGGVFSLGGRLYVGVVDYDGETQGTAIPVQSDTDYLGVQFDALGGYRFARHLHGLDLLGGAGVDFWRRSIDDTFVPGLGQVYGGDEDYYAFFAKLGLGYFHEMGKARHYVQTGVKYPFYVYEYAYLLSADDISLEPKGRPSLFAKYQIEFGSSTHNRFGLTIYYDSYRFKQSDAVAETVNGRFTGRAFVQPESRQDTLGIQLGYYFR